MGKAKGKKRTSKAKKREEKMNADIVGIIYVASGLILSIAIYTSLAGALSSIAQRVAYALIGVGAYALPLYLIYFGFQYIKTRGHIEVNKNFFGISMLVIIVMLTCGIIDIQTSRFPDAFIENSRAIIMENSSILHGGIISYLICYPVYRLIGIIGAYIILFTFAVISIMLIFNITLYDVYIGLSDGKKKIQENLIESREKSARSSIEKSLKNEKRSSSFINIVEKNQDQYVDDLEDNEEEKKDIKILDFVKEQPAKTEVSADKTQNIKIDNFMDNVSQSSSRKKDKLTSEVKDVVNKEIEEQISEEKGTIEYTYPSLDLLNQNESTKLNSSDKKELIENAGKLVEILSNFGVEAKVTQVTKGPSVTRFELQPSPGVKVSKIVNLSDDIALGLAASGIIIQAPIPGKAAVGIEVPNSKQIGRDV